ncbi:hypothetical protein WMY93_021640 [Mugilogobius chulae]|uniref:Poly [ADP-ribose] polymerase 12-like n=1 Tax=Mugilogobius chulae TaxID=88201 RepID=A0AAW0NCI5_9GOBI
METDILKYILSNQGSVDTDELFYNLGNSTLLTEIICNNDKFVSCQFNRRPVVVVQSRLRLCWTCDCPGCGNLHLCLRFLYSGTCHFTTFRRSCSFSHDLHSEYNLQVLREFGLETLSRTELCLLLLQSNNSLLPQICHTYNNTGCCDECKRLHICERYLSRHCTCPRTHDFSAPQPLKLLHEKHIPEELFKILKSVYANKKALRLANKQNRDTNQAASSLHITKEHDLSTGDNDSDSSSVSTKQTSGYVKRGGRGGRGGRGWRGGRGGRGQTGAFRGQRQKRVPSQCDPQDSTYQNFNTETNDSSQDQDTIEETLQDNYDSDSSSTTALGNDKDNKEEYARGRGGYRGQRGKGRGRGSKHTASNFNFNCLTNEAEANRIGRTANYRGKSRGGRGGGNWSDKAERMPSQRDSQEDKDDMEGNDNRDPAGSGETLSSYENGSDKKQDSSSGGGSSYGTKAKTNSTSNSQNPQQSCVKNTDRSSSGSQRRQRGNQTFLSCLKYCKKRDLICNLYVSLINKTEICVYFIPGHCLYEDRCFNAHDKMPYRWEIKQDGQWTPMAENETIEKDYCDPGKTYSTSSPPVHFDTMTCGPDEVRRLSTVNSVLQPRVIHTTDWLWYWEDEYGKWYQYAAVTSEHRLASITSKELEEMFVKNNKDVVRFTAGSQSYELSFQDMIQTNLNYGTKRLVRRRPQFVSAAEVRTKTKRPAHSTGVPDNWDKTQIPQIGFKRVPLLPSSEEYKDIQARFSRTMAAFEILTIERIQNKAVWEAFQLHKTHMKNKNGGKFVREEKLFHGTEPKSVDTICETNFDWRVCGVNGTVYGQEF